MKKKLLLYLCGKKLQVGEKGYGGDKKTLEKITVVSTM